MPIHLGWRIQAWDDADDTEPGDEIIEIIVTRKGTVFAFLEECSPTCETREMVFLKNAVLGWTEYKGDDLFMIATIERTYLQEVESIHNKFTEAVELLESVVAPLKYLVDEYPNPIDVKNLERIKSWLARNKSR